MGNNTELRRETKRTFVPFVKARGFKIDQRYAPQLFEFRRANGGELHLFDIKWE